MARPDTWMPLYIADYLADTTELTTFQHGAFLLLLFTYWRNGKALPDNDAALAQIARCSLREWRANRAPIAQKFDVASGIWWSKRLEEELAKAKAHFDAKTKAGAEGARRRWQKDSRPIAEASVRQSQTDAPSPSHSPNGEDYIPEAASPKTRKQKKQIPTDWMPNQQDAAHAAAKGLDAKTISNLGEQFRDHHTAKGTAFASVSAAWRTWVNNHVNWNGCGPWPRPEGQQPARNGRSSGSVVDIVTRAKAKVSGADAVSEGRRVPDGDRPRGDAGDDGNSEDPGQADDPGVIESDDAERMYRDAWRGEVDHGEPSGARARLGGSTDYLRPEASGLSGGHRSEDPGYTSEPQQMVADVAGVDRAAGPAHAAPQSPAERDDIGPMPAFLKRHANAF